MKGCGDTSKSLTHNRPEDYYLGKETGEYPKMSLSGLPGF